MSDTWTTEQAAEAWGMTKNNASKACAAGRVPGATYIVRNGHAEWAIPAGTARPNRMKSGPKPKERGE